MEVKSRGVWHKVVFSKFNLYPLTSYYLHTVIVLLDNKKECEL